MKTIGIQAFMGAFLCLVVWLASSAAYSGGFLNSTDGKTGLEIRRRSIDDPKTTIPFPGELEQQELEVRWSPIRADVLDNELGSVRKP